MTRPELLNKSYFFLAHVNDVLVIQGKFQFGRLRDLLQISVVIPSEIIRKS